MTIKTILTEPNKKLRQVSLPVEKVGKEEQNLMNDMLETMYDAKGIGLAAVQVNITKRLIVIDISEDRNNPLILINPTIKAKDEKIQFEEGCLSVPGFYEKINRFNKIEFEAQNLSGNYFTDKAEGLLAVCVQHEIDHLDGKLFVDYLSQLKRGRIAKKITKLESQGTLPTRKNVPYSI